MIKRYVVHIRVLKQASDNRLTLKQVHKLIQFSQNV